MNSITYLDLLKYFQLSLNENQEQYREGRLETESDLTCGSKNVIFERVQTEVSPNWRKQNCILQTWLQLIESGMQIRRS